MFVLAAAACAQGPKPSVGVAPAAKSEKSDSTQPIKPYDKVITAKAITRRGLVITHEVDDKLYFETPRSVLGTDMLLVTTIARASGGQTIQYGGDWVRNYVVRWERIGPRVVLTAVSYDAVADTTLPIARAVAKSSYPAVIASFPIETFGPDSAPVIDVTKLYTTGITDMAAFKERFDDKRSFVERVLAFPDNVEIEATQTQSGDAKHSTESVLAHWSMVRLPEDPMTPRRADPRMGYFTVSQTDYGTTEQRAAKREYIGRWRLVKRDTTAAVSDPVKPLVYYIDPATPSKWVPWIKKGIEDWQPAFLAAGFSHAIVARDVPVGDTTWSVDDIRHTVIRWLPSPIENAYGPQMVDPRTGEVLNGSVRIFHNVMNLLRDWYTVQVAPLDPRAQRWPLPDSLMGFLLEGVVAHEVGHTLGLRHNMQASSEYPADSMRSRTWLHKMGHTSSVMDYARYDYVAQPQDSVNVNDLVMRIGPYDVFAIHWGYAPVSVNEPAQPGSGARAPRALTGTALSDAERPTLDRWLMAQDTVPWLRFAEDYGLGGADPGVETEAIGDADAVYSTGLGFKNIERIAPMMTRIALRPGETNDDLTELYDQLVGQWATEAGHVAHIVGGEWSRHKSGSQPGPQFEPVAAARQRAAVAFLAQQVWRTPNYLLDHSILTRIEAQGALERLRRAQAQSVHVLLDGARLSRMTELSAITPAGTDVYDAASMMDDVRKALWSELDAKEVRIDAFRRNLEREHLAALDALLNPPSPPKDEHHDDGLAGDVPAVRANETDARALARGELEAIRDAARKAETRSADRITRLHLEESVAEIEQSLSGQAH
jgi:Met-zincin/Domain of unknown function (DUF5117)/Domain of unknown function (DUF5118)